MKKFFSLTSKRNIDSFGVEALYIQDEKKYRGKAKDKQTSTSKCRSSEDLALQYATEEELRLLFGKLSSAYFERFFD